MIMYNLAQAAILRLEAYFLRKGILAKGGNRHLESTAFFGWWRKYLCGYAKLKDLVTDLTRHIIKYQPGRSFDRCVRPQTNRPLHYRVT